MQQQATAAGKASGMGYANQFKQAVGKPKVTPELETKNLKAGISSIKGEIGGLSGNFTALMGGAAFSIANTITGLIGGAISTVTNSLKSLVSEVIRVGSEAEQTRVSIETHDRGC
jgi:hypothetical protein